MERLTLTPRPDFTKPPRQTYAPEPTEIVEGDVLLLDTEGNPLGFSVKLTERYMLLEQMVRELRFKVKWDDVAVSTSQSRMSGIRTVSRVFGYTGPKPLRRRYGGSAAQIHRENPRLSQLLEDVTPDLWALFAGEAPEAAGDHFEKVKDRIHPDWWFGVCPWTSGVINRTSLLPYHRDSGNIAGTWSAMLCLRRGVEGGHLTLPEYDVTLAIPNHSVTVFNGQQQWHGVTPMTVKGEAYRYTLVWYAKSDLAACGPASEEAHRAALAATEKSKRQS